MIQVYTATVATGLLTALWFRDDANIKRAEGNIKVIDDEIEREKDSDNGTEGIIHKLTVEAFELQKKKQVEFLQNPWYKRVTMDPSRPNVTMAKRYAEDKLRMVTFWDAVDSRRLEATKIQMLN